MFQVESEQSCGRDMFLLLAPDSLSLSDVVRSTEKGPEKIVPEREKESMRSAS